MPAPILHAFAFSSAYIGDYGDSAVLTQIVDLRYNGAALSDQVPTTYSPAVNNYVQSGNRILTVSLNFYSDSILMNNLARGQSSVSTSSTDTFAAYKYCLLLLGPDDGTKSSYYFPELSTKKIFNIEYKKDTAASITIDFLMEKTSVNDILQYKKTIDELRTIMSSRSPI